MKRTSVVWCHCHNNATPGLCGEELAYCTAAFAVLFTFRTKDTVEIQKLLVSARGVQRDPGSWFAQ
jgi:hypothetical protein